MKKSRYALALIFAASMPYILEASFQEEWPLNISYPETPLSGFHTAGQWTENAHQLQSPGHGIAAITPIKYSALKGIEIETTFTCTPSQTQGAAGIQLGFSLVKSVYWTYMYFPAEKKLKLRFHYKDTTKICKSYDTELTSPYTLKIELKSDAQTRLWANHKLIDDKNNPLGGIPTFYNSGIVSIDAAASFSRLTIRGGDYVRPAIALGDSITHHCRWQHLVEQKTGLPITNAGMACEATPQTRERFVTDVLALHPKLLFLYIGTNDTDAATALKNVKAMAEAAQKAGIKVILCTLIPRCGMSKIEEFNRDIRRYAAEHHLPLVDWNQVMNDGTQKIRADYCSSEGVHPNPVGTKIMADFLCSDKEISTILNSMIPSKKAQQQPALVPHND